MLLRYMSLMALALLTSHLHMFSQEIIFKVYTSPLKTVDIFSRQMISMGTEVKPFPHFSISGEYGYKYKDFRSADTSYIKSRGESYSIELKYYDVPFIKMGRLDNYVSFEYRFIKDHLNDEFEYYKDSQSLDIIVDNFGVKKNIQIGNIKYGIIINLGKTIYIDAFAGIGIRLRDIKNVRREFDEDLGHEAAYVDAVLDPTNFAFKETSGIYFNPSLGFKFGIRI